MEEIVYELVMRSRELSMSWLYLRLAQSLSNKQLLGVAGCYA